MNGLDARARTLDERERAILAGAPAWGMTPAPRNLRYPPHAIHTEPVRRDPGYDEPLPLAWADLRQMLRDLPVAIALLVGLGAFAWLVMAVLS